MIRTLQFQIIPATAADDAAAALLRLESPRDPLEKWREFPPIKGSRRRLPVCTLDFCKIPAVAADEAAAAHLHLEIPRDP